MFKSVGRSLPDLSTDLREREDWQVGTLRTVDHVSNASAIAFDPLSSILAVGTIDGTIRIFGAPGVETSLTPPSRAAVKFLQFATNVFKLVCIDEDSRLHLWDLTAHGQIRLEASMRLDRPVTCLVLSPSHTHAFIGLGSGEIQTYDLLCRRVSTYVIANAWEAYEKNLIASGMLTDTVLEATSRTPVDIVMHPRNINFIFIAYGGGIVLFDLKEQKTLHTYELLIPAGAPGGSGYTDPDLLKHRRPNVSSLSVHPAGHFFAVGHLDGSITFWAVEDAEQPLMVRTLDEVDVHKVDGEALERYLSDDEAFPKPPSKVHVPREPIFKLAWSGYPNSYDPRGGETSLVVLGGQLGHDPPGINVLWLPAFNPPAPPSPAADQSLHPFFRDAMRGSLDPLSAYFYHTPGLAQDFLLMPRDSPHFGGTWNPMTILMLFESGENIRAIEAWQFPPLEFLASAQEASQSAREPKEEGDGHDALTQDLSATLQSMTVNEEPKKFSLPPPLWSGLDAVVDAGLFSIDRIAYETLSKGSERESDELPLEGGVSVPDEDIASAIKYAKYEPRRIIVTRNADLTIRFLDISVQLLIPTPQSPFISAFPRALPLLSMDVLALASLPEIARHLRPEFSQRVQINDVQLAIESLEVGLVLGGGEVLVYRMADRQCSSARQLPDKQLVSLEHLPVSDGLRFKPYFLVKAESPVTAFAMSDVGFASVAYANESLTVIDMRGPRMILQVGKAQQTTNRLSFINRNSASTDPILSLAWAISGVKSDATPRIRLIAVHALGLVQIYTLARGDNGMWSIPSAPFEVESLPATLNAGTFVLDAHTGAPCKANKANLTVALEFKASPTAPEESIRYLLLIVGARGARCFADLGDERVARVEWGNKMGNAVRAQVVERNGSYALAVFTDRHDALVYSLPMLEHLHTLPLPIASSIVPSVDSSGDLLTLIPLHDPVKTSSVPAAHTTSPTPASTSTATRSVSATNTTATFTVGIAPPSPAKRLRLDTLFNIRRGYHVPLVSLTERKDGAQHNVPPAPAPVSLGPDDWRSWFGGLVGSTSVTGDQIDALLAGPDRPVPEKPEPRTEKTGYTLWEADASKAAGVSTAAERTRNALYDRLHAAVSERGEMLGNLETSVNSLEQGSKNMLAQAKVLAAKQTAKSWMPKF
ncbi:lethal giant larvae like, C-terminal-domain-containing protein [Russula earlei]|uniref:Lethal giant larvae like, C-terminal-domain-containing protein n=1 Tax=Russula earlei TaxID=71964 RepID=A0ACC0U5N5_9AGAM|nr:lethal giant larvae like, C-terminal-domain-containing protein [Russula earlei]